MTGGERHSAFFTASASTSCDGVAERGLMLSACPATRYALWGDRGRLSPFVALADGLHYRSGSPSVSLFRHWSRATGTNAQAGMVWPTRSGVHVQRSASSRTGQMSASCGGAIYGHRAVCVGRVVRVNRGRLRAHGRREFYGRPRGTRLATGARHAFRRGGHAGRGGCWAPRMDWSWRGHNRRLRNRRELGTLPKLERAASQDRAPRR